jgi:hypothetical protein
MRTAAAIEDSRDYASPVHLWIGSSRQWSFRRLHSAPSIAPFSSPNNRNCLAILMLRQANPFSMTLPISSGLELPSHRKRRRAFSGRRSWFWPALFIPLL